MKQTKLIKTAAGLLCCLLIISSAIFGSLAVGGVPSIRNLKTYAGGYVKLQDDGEGKVEITDLSENFFAPFAYGGEATQWMMPGGSDAGTITMKNNGTLNVMINLYAKSVGPERRNFLGWEIPANGVASEYEYFRQNNDTEYSALQLQNISNILVNEKMLLKIYRYFPASDDTGHEYDESWTPRERWQLLYRGKLSGQGQQFSEYSEEPTQARSEVYVNPTNDNDWSDCANLTGAGGSDIDEDGTNKNLLVDFITMGPGESVTLLFKLHIPDDLPGHFSDAEMARVNANPSPVPNPGFSHTVAMIDWKFVVGAAAAPPIGPDPSSEPGSDSKPEPGKPIERSPGTGDASFGYAFASAACAVSAAAIFYLTFVYQPRKRKEEESFQKRQRSEKA